MIIPGLADGSNPKVEYKNIQRQMLKQKKKIRSTQRKEIKIMKEIHFLNTQLNKSEAELAVLRKNLAAVQSQIAGVTLGFRKIG
jgi:septal ring factor EnvC (AmiA/AmiB activator)